MKTTNKLSTYSASPRIFMGRPVPIGTKMDWRDRLSVGDSVLSKRGTRRTVRHISRDTNGYLHCVAFSILRCSWTHACYTIYTRNDLRCLGFKPSKAKKRTLTKRIDKRIYLDIVNSVGKPCRKLKCCDVKGVV